MTRKRIFVLGCVVLAAAVSPALSASAQIARDGRDRLVPAGATGAAAGYKGQPWWAPLGECSAVFSGGGKPDRANFFMAQAMMRVADDRTLKAEDARDLVRPWIQTTGKSRAGMLAMGFGQAAVEGNCEALLKQYEAG